MSDYRNLLKPDIPEPRAIAFISGAMSGGTPEEVRLNINAARHIQKLLTLKGYHCYCPHSNSFGLDRLIDAPTEFFYKGDLLLLPHCDIVVMVPGWELSKGARDEYDEAYRLGCIIYKHIEDVPPADTIDLGAQCGGGTHHVRG